MSEKCQGELFVKHVWNDWTLGPLTLERNPCQFTRVERYRFLYCCCAMIWVGLQRVRMMDESKVGSCVRKSFGVLVLPQQGQNHTPCITEEG